MKTVGIILAGGQSRRMGQNKALLPYRKKRLIDHMMRLLQGISFPVYISGTIAGYPCIPDQTPGLGPMGGILSVVDFLLPQGFQKALFVPVDMPCLTAKILLPLTVFEEEDAMHYIHHPLPLGIKITAFPKQPLPPNLAVYRFLETLTVRTLHTTKTTQHFVNANTPEEWMQVLNATHNMP